MKFTELNDNNYVIFAIKNYENPHAVTKEDFEEDLKRFKWIKRLLKRYKTTGVLKAHLLINHFIILYNVFGEAATPLLFYKIDKDLWPVVKTFIVYLGRLPEYPRGPLHDVPMDDTCLTCLKEL
jgi:hypothetical protein|tara:strand:+ start:157 stop:528 length:372 start_codon:yes stop_codon:yes gene_type:complete